MLVLLCGIELLLIPAFLAWVRERRKRRQS
jgi:hypothetical protein